MIALDITEEWKDWALRRAETIEYLYQQYKIRKETVINKRINMNV